MFNTPTAIAQIKKHFESGKSLSHMECSGLYGTHRLAAYVHTLRHKHKMNIVDEPKVALNGKRYFRYWLNKEEPTVDQAKP